MHTRFRRALAFGLAALAFAAVPTAASAVPDGTGVTTFEEISGEFGASGPGGYDYSVQLFVNTITHGTEVAATAQVNVEVTGPEGYWEQCEVNVDVDPALMETFTLHHGFLHSGPTVELPGCSLQSLSIDGHWYGYGALNKSASVSHDGASACIEQVQTRHANIEVSFGFGDSPTGPIDTYDLEAYNDAGYLQLTVVRCG